MRKRSDAIHAESLRVGFPKWPRQLLGPPPGLKEINLACWGALAAFLALKVGVPLWLEARTGVPSLHILPADFIYFYGIGSIANYYPLARLYDYKLQLRTFNAIYALHDGAYGPSPYPPFVALFFSPLARLRFTAAFSLWAFASVAMYLGGIGAVLKSAFPCEPLKASLVYCLALAFYPFLIGTLANGQLAAVAVCALGLAIAGERAGKPWLCGLALSLLAYKATLLLLLVPMLLLTRRLKALAGLLAGTCVLVLVATAFGGFAVWPAYLRFISLFGRVAGSGRSGLPLAKFVDILSCVQAALGSQSPIGNMIAAIVAAFIVIALAILWWRSACAARPAQMLAWATALTWTLLINVYVPIYDAVLVAVAVMLTIGAAALMEEREAIMGWIVLLAISVEAASCFTSEIAAQYRVQILSIAIAVLGLAQMRLLKRAIAQSPRAPRTEPAANTA